MTAETQGDRVAQAEDEMDRSAAEMQERVDKLDSHIGETKETWERAKKGDMVPTAAGDWEDTEDDAGGDDASAFDDPEVEETDEDEEKDADA